MSLAGHWADLLGLPRPMARCVVCGAAAGVGLCNACAGAFPALGRCCGVCGLPEPVRRCPRAAGGWRVARVFALFAYAAPLDEHLHALKYNGARAVARGFAERLAAAVNERAPWVRDAEIVVPVPLGRRRWRERGYNQAAEIARPFAKLVGLPCRFALRRGESVAAQSSLAARQRRANVSGAFRASRAVAGRRVLILDDVITTGATVNAAAEAVLAAGAIEVTAIAVARTAPRARRDGLAEAQAAGDRRKR